MHARMRHAVILVFFVIMFLNSMEVEAELGVNWGTVTSHRLPDKMIIELLRSCNVTKVKLFDADPNAIRVFRNTEFELMIAVPNDMLWMMASNSDGAERWVEENVTRHLPSVNIRYVAVGNEPFLKAYNGTYQDMTLPALKAVQEALEGANLGDRIKAIVPMNADVLSTSITGSDLPSSGIFRPDIQLVMQAIVGYLDKHKSPFTVNIYPFLSLHQDPHFPKEFAFFDGAARPIIDKKNTYTNVFDASFDLLASALTRNGYPEMPIIVGEVGWPTDGDIEATVENAERFNRQLLLHVNRGTPLRSGAMEVYLFGLIDEDAKSILPGNFERHWGVFRYDGVAKYDLSSSSSSSSPSPSSFSILPKPSGAEYLPSRWCVLNPDGDMKKLADNVAYACTYGDCTALAYGGSCNNIGSNGNASYAFNSYYQIHDQTPESCVFDGLAMVIDVNPSADTCEFIIQLALPPFSSSPPSPATLIRVLIIFIIIFVSYA